MISGDFNKKLLSLPPIIKSNVPGTWAFDTMSRRIHSDILPRIIADNSDELLQPTSEMRSEAFLVLNDLKDSLESGSMGFLRGISDSGPDLELWDSILGEVTESERNWLDSPWIISEFYFYRRIMEAFKYFETKYDPFMKQKVDGLIESLPYVEDVALRLPTLLLQKPEVIIDIAFKTSLWGNKMDLSLWPASKTSGRDSGIDQEQQIQSSSNSFILDDHTAEVIAQLFRAKAAGGPVSLDVIVDNAGYELVSDLFLGNTLLVAGIVDKVTYHTKGHPTFVSDATTVDLLETVSLLQRPFNGIERPATAAFAQSVQRYLDNGDIQVADDLFWCQPTAFWDMPPAVLAKLRGSSLVVVKGDANYRRLLGDRMWPMDTPAATVLDYWRPVPVCALRTCKAELGCGLSIDAQQRAAAADPKWLVSGKWGVIQVGGL